jgi:hypothetical protein
MTTHQLAQVLLAGPDIMVTRHGYEGGVHEITQVAPPCPIHLDVNEYDYYGPHEYCEGGWCVAYLPPDEDHVTPTTMAIHLS